MANNRDTDALEAIRTRLGTIGGLWPVVWHNRKSQAQPTTFDATVGWILEMPVGGPSQRTTLGPAAPTREQRKLYQLLLHAPADSGLDYVAQADLLDAGLTATPITMTDTNGTVTVAIDQVNRRPPREPTRTIAWWTVPVVVSYRFAAV